MASCRDCPCNSASCRESRQEAESHGQSPQESIYQVQQSRHEARDHGQSRRKPNMTDSLCRKRKLANSFIPCGIEKNRKSSYFQNYILPITLFFRVVYTVFTIPVTQRQPSRQRTTNATEINKQSYGVNTFW